MVDVDFFRALGDPTRLEIIKRLTSGTEHTISSVSEGLPISRQAVRKHLQVLLNAQIIILQHEGRDTNIKLNREALEQGKAFIEKIEKQWDKRLLALKKFVES